MRALLVLAIASALATPAAAQSWQVFARSNSRAYLLDVASITKTDDISTARIAFVSRGDGATDYSHAIESYEYRCAEDRWRTAGMIEYGPDSAEAGSFPEADAQWEEVRPRSISESLKLLVCYGQRAQGQAYETIKAYIDAGRP